MAATKLTASGTSDGYVATAGDDGSLEIWVGPNGAKLRAIATDATGQVALFKPLLDSSFQLNTSNGYGSSSNVVRLFTNIAAQRGSWATDYTIVNSATLGSVITINTSDYYSFSYSESVSAAMVFGISLNSTQLTTPMLNINLADRLTASCCEATNGIGFCGGRFYLPAGSVIRCHTNATVGGTVAFAQLRVSRG